MGTIREYKKADGSTTYHAEIRLKGKPPQRDTFRTKTAAKKWIQDTESGIRDGRHFKTAESKRHTVGEMIDRYTKQWLTAYPERVKKQSALLGWWKNRLGLTLLSELSSALIAEARDSLLSEKTLRGELRTGSTVNRYMAAFSKVLSVAIQEWGWLEDNPMRKVAKPKENQGRNRFLSIEEKNRLLEACKTSSNPHLYAIVSIAMLTAMRQGEILNLRWEDIDFTNKCMTLEKTKNKERHILPLTDSVENILNQIDTPDRKGRIFKSSRRDNQDGVVEIRKAFLKALKVAGIDSFRFHDLRHTAASYFAMGGATQGELMSILNHKSPSMTRKYSHFSQKHISSLMKRVNLDLIGVSSE